MAQYDAIYRMVSQIPPGTVATYGQIARMAGIPRQARQVGYALSALQDSDIPWHRVVNRKGEISKRSNPVYEEIQRHLLEQEGIVFTRDNRIPLREYLWQP